VQFQHSSLLSIVVASICKVLWELRMFL
jgi:hypothetical protein